MTRTSAGHVLAVFLASAALAGAQETYRSAAPDSSGALHIVTSRGRVIRPASDSDQAGVEHIALSPNRRVVGWVVLFPNCCTSYPIPLKLVVWPIGSTPVAVASDLPIWQWAFVDGGARVVLRESPVHGAGPSRFELRDARTGGLLRAADAKTDSARPAWARVLAEPTSARTPRPISNW